MGWTAVPMPDRPASAELNAFFDSELTDEHRRIIDRSGWTNHGKRQFLVVETRAESSPGITKNTRSMILLLAEHSHSALAYKVVEESMEPLAVDCPMRLMHLLQDGQDPGEEARSWRQQVMDYHSNRRETGRILKEVRRTEFGGERRIILTDGHEVQYEPFYHRGKRGDAYRGDRQPELIRLRQNDIDHGATRKAWTEEEPADRQRT